MPTLPLPLGMAPLVRVAAAASTSLDASTFPSSRSGTASAASSSETDYVPYTHHVHGSRVWTWDGRSGISLVFIVALLASLLALFLALVGLSRLLARINAPSTSAILPFQRRDPSSQGPPQMAQMPPPMNTKLSTPGLQGRSGLLAPPVLRYASTPDSRSPASSSQNVVLPLLKSAAPVGQLGKKAPPKRLSSGPDGPPPAVRNPKRTSRYGGPSVGVSALPVRHPSQRSRDSRESFHNTQDQRGGNVKRVQSIGRGNSTRRYSRSIDAEQAEAELGRSHSARLAARDRARRSQHARPLAPPSSDTSPTSGSSGEYSDSMYKYNVSQDRLQQDIPRSGRRGASQ